MRKQISLFSAIAFFACASIAQAGLVGVKEIEIRSSLPTWLQVSEVVATETGTGDDLALMSAGATATSLSNWTGSSPLNAIDGIAPAPFPNISHSGGNGPLEFLLVTLDSPSELDSITLYGRTDCCSGRDIFDLVLRDYNGSVLFQASDLNATGSNDHLVTVYLPNTGNTPVPEPSTIGLMVTGLLGLGAWRRKRVH